MDKTLFAITAVGIDKNRQSICNLLIDLERTGNYGEVPGKNLRQFFDLTKEKLFNILENLVTHNILKYTTHTPVYNIIYIRGGKGNYIINSDYETWIPADTSLFSKICRLRGYRFTVSSWKMVINEYDIRTEIKNKKDKKEKDINLAPFQLYSEFCSKYKRMYNREYRPTHIAKDLSYCKLIICECSFRSYTDYQILEFLNWVFTVKARSYKGEFIIGFLPVCLKDYIASNIIQIVKPGYIKDENGNIVKHET